jgi:methyl-accepting chemotaxis protein
VQDPGAIGGAPEEVIMKNAVHFAALTLVSIAIAVSGFAAQNQGRASRTTGPDAAAVKAVDEMGSDLEKLNESHQNLMKAVGELNGIYTKLAKKVEEVSRIAADASKTKGDPAGQLLKATEQMQEMQMSFNLQYLQLQNTIAHENRQFSMVSTIMKSKHDTARNAINNIR